MKSFRYLCSVNKYAIPVKEKIVEDNTVRSATNRRFVIKKDCTNITKFFVIDNFEKTFSEGSIYNPNLDSYTLVFFAKNGEMVKKISQFILFMIIQMDAIRTLIIYICNFYQN